MGKLKPFVVVVDDDGSVSRAIKRLLLSIGIAADTFASLALLLGVENVSVFPQGLEVVAAYRVGVDVQRFDSVPGETVTIDARCGPCVLPGKPLRWQVVPSPVKPWPTGKAALWWPRIVVRCRL
ncbi:ABC-type transport auxiliary lipoprotein family protein [Paraburkholderia fungorum]